MVDDDVTLKTEVFKLYLGDVLKWQGYWERDCKDIVQVYQERA